MAVPELPTTLEKWYDLAVQLDRQWRQAVAKKKTFAAHSGKGDTGSGSNPNTRQSPAPPVAPSYPAQDPNVMEVDCNQSQCRCYNCSQAGHFAHNCTQPRHQQTRLVEAWHGGNDAKREELWRMMGAGTADVALEEATIRQVQSTSRNINHFRFSQ
ncbi:hypothetical protein AMATHDRAFT_168122 [Amanita thiersii Skay4041]|uniref:CCHC-type domain-containing protein n=1 Tax=Amanita thiersii Skay4041 TaxID=703135 RepID=A0A2A9N6H5_9AGAR|nr:hypothetical protein AMATHDRAFT_168122 [Amanita thiersii Skay4041]